MTSHTPPQAPQTPVEESAAPAGVPQGPSGGIGRRGALGLGAAAVVGGAVGAGATWLVPRLGDAEEPAATGDRIAFHGVHQAGIASAVQDRMHTAAFDLTTTEKAAVVKLLKKWTVAAESMTAGSQIGAEGAFPSVVEAPPEDTGEAVGLPASRLTITVGFGASLLAKTGLADSRPAALIDLPHFAADQLDDARSGGDLVVQACADDPQVAVHAIRNLARIGFGTVTVRWSQLGFGKTSSTTPSALTPRNLFGFKDGTANIAGDDETALRQHVWVDGAQDGVPAWMTGGSYMVARRIAMRIETWDRSALTDQEQIIGRTKEVGAPLGRDGERDEILLSSIPKDSHVALAHPDNNDGVRLLRRGYSFVDGSDGLGRLDAGLFFVAFVADPAKQFVPMQSKLSRMDALSEYLVHTASGVWAVPPGVQNPGEYWGQALFEA